MATIPIARQPCVMAVAAVLASACGPSPTGHVASGSRTTPTVSSSGKTYTYDLQDGTETESIITNVFDTWPPAA